MVMAECLGRTVRNGVAYLGAIHTDIDTPGSPSVLTGSMIAVSGSFREMWSEAMHG